MSGSLSEPDYTQLYLPLSDFNAATTLEKGASRETDSRVNRLDSRDRAFHDWYRFVLSFPPHLVRDYIEGFGLGAGQAILDPFCGTGTTLVESRLHGMRAIGLEANPIAHFASSVKVDWEIDPDSLTGRAHDIADSTLKVLRAQGIDDNQPFQGSPQNIPLRTLDPEANKLLLANSVSPLPLHKTLVLLDRLKEHQGER